MIPTWNIQKGVNDFEFIKDDTFNSIKITFPFTITTSKIEMQFKLRAGTGSVFSWSTEDGTFEKISSTEIIMKSRLLAYPANNYISDMQVTLANGTVTTYLRANLKIVQDITV
jgi:hypothetical protein